MPYYTEDDLRALQCLTHTAVAPCSTPAGKLSQLGHLSHLEGVGWCAHRVSLAGELQGEPELNTQGLSLAEAWAWFGALVDSGSAPKYRVWPPTERLRIRAPGAAWLALEDHYPRELAALSEQFAAVRLHAFQLEVHHRIADSDPDWRVRPGQEWLIDTLFAYDSTPATARIRGPYMVAYLLLDMAQQLQEGMHELRALVEGVAPNGDQLLAWLSPEARVVVERALQFSLETEGPEMGVRVFPVQAALERLFALDTVHAIFAALRSFQRGDVLPVGRRWPAKPSELAWVAG